MDRFSFKGQIGGQEAGRPHVDRHFPIVFQARINQTTCCFDANLALLCQALVMHELDETACTIATLLDFAAIGIEYPVAKGGFWRGGMLDNQ